MLIQQGVNVATANRETSQDVDPKNDSSSDARKRLLINRHIAKMTPGEIARRFSVYIVPVKVH